MNKKQQQHQKPSEGKTMGPRGANAIRVPKNELDTADFLIDGLTYDAPTALERGGAGFAFLIGLYRKRRVLARGPSAERKRTDTRGHLRA